jgi:hypothetical protein
MGDRVDELFREWAALGAPVIVAEREPSPAPRRSECLIAESTAHCRDSGRLTWVVRHGDELDSGLLLDQTRAGGDSAVLGVLCDAARERSPSQVLDQVVARCEPNERLEHFFHRVARSPLAARLAEQEALELFRRWNFLNRELRHLSDEMGAASVTWLLSPVQPGCG